MKFSVWQITLVPEKIGTNNLVYLITIISTYFAIHENAFNLTSYRVRQKCIKIKQLFFKPMAKISRSLRQFSDWSS